MSATLFTSSKYSATDAAGLPLAFGLVYTYAAGSLTPQATYTSQSGVSPNTNPVVLDASGRANIWLGPYAYRFIVKNAVGVLMPDGDTDNITNPTASVQLTQPTTDLMTGDGVTTTYTLSANPGNVNNVFFSLGGAIQVPGVDYTISGVVITCTSPPPAGVAGFFNYTVAMPVGTNDASLVNFSGQVNYPVGTVGRKLREYPSVADYGAVGNGTTDDTAAFIAAQAAAPFVRVPSGFVCKVSAGLNYWKFFGEGKVFEAGIQWDVSRTPQTGALGKLYKVRTFGTYEQATGFSVTINSGQAQTRNNTQVLGTGTQGMAQTYVSRDHVAAYISSASFDPMLMDATTTYTSVTLVNAAVPALFVAGSLLPGMIIDTLHTIPFTGRIQSVAGNVITVDAWYPATPNGTCVTRAAFSGRGRHGRRRVG